MISDLKKQLTHYILLLLIAGSSFISCEKPPADEDPRILQEGEDEAVNLKLKEGDDIASTCWNIYCYARQVYFWNNELPKSADYNPSRYENLSEELAIQKLLSDITNVSKGDDKWSYVQNIQTGKVLYAGGPPTEFANIPSLGVSLIKKESKWYCQYVNPGSPAARAGVRRGVRLDSQNKQNGIATFSGEGGFKVSVYNDSQYKPLPNVESQVFVVKNRDNNSSTNVGYLFFDQFEKDDLRAVYDVIDYYFTPNDVSVLVIDLRYNSGGMGYLAEGFLESILPEKFNGQLMHTYQYNDILSAGKAILLKKQFLVDGRSLYETQIQANSDKSFYLKKYEELETVEKIYFIVSGRTASSSELVIHGLQAYSNPLGVPYINVKIIGKQTRGKGYGWDLPIKVKDWQINLITSAYQNKNGQFLPPGGLSPSLSKFNIADDLNYELGNENEPCLKAALDDIGKSPHKRDRPIF